MLFRPNRSQSYHEAIEDFEKDGCVPLGVIAYNPETDTFHLKVLTKVDPDEVNAILEKTGLRFIPKGKS